MENKYYIVGGLALIGGYLIYRLYPTKPPEDAKFHVSIMDPSRAERWSDIVPHTIDAVVTNQNNKAYDVWVGCSIIDHTGWAHDFDALDMSLQGNESKKVQWWLNPTTIKNHRHGWLTIVVKTWDSFPSSTAKCLGKDDVTFYYGVI